MQVTHKQLTSVLKQPPAKIYLISGDETLLVQQTREQLLAMLKQQGFADRELFTVGTGFDWGRVMHSHANLSLFSTKKMIDLRLAKWDDAATKAITHGFDNPNPNTVILITLPKLTAAQKKTRWYRTLDDAGVCITVWPISAKELPSWITEQLRQFNLSADSASIRLLVELTEGNLLATHQAIEKLALLDITGKVTVDDIARVATHTAQYTAFNLVDYALAGDSKACVRALHMLQAESAEPVLIIWAIARELRKLAAFVQQHQAGQPIGQVVAREWASKRPILQSAIQRHNTTSVLSLLRLCSRIDRMIKGQLSGNVWESLTRLVLYINNVNTLGKSDFA